MRTVYVDNYEEYVKVCKKAKEEGKRVLNMHTNVKTKDGVKIAVIVVSK